MSIENWKTDLAPLLHGFQKEKRQYVDSECVFTDQFGNFISLGGGNEVMCWAPVLMKLLKNPSLGKVEVQDVDRGHLSYTAYHHAESYYVLYETRVDLNGYCGHYTSFVVVPDLSGIIELVEKLMAENQY